MTDVVVVGAGPVGLVAACELAGRGVAVRIVDRLAAPTQQSRAIVVHARSLEMFERMGIVDDIIGSGVKTVAMQMFASGRRLARVDLDHVESAYPYSITTAQTETERILTHRLRTLGGTVERGADVIGLSQDEHGVHMDLRHADGTTERMDTSYAIGADGAHSTIRDQIGVHLAGSFQGERFLLGDVDAEHNLDPSSFHTFFTPDGPLLIFPMRAGRVRILALVDEPAGRPRSTDVTQDELQRLVDERSQGITIVRSHWLTEFEIHHAQVPAYRVGRVFLAGDAAHVHSPAGGQGMNTGMQDAFNLGWKLASAVGGGDRERLLDSYHAERHPVAAGVIAFSNRLTAIGTVRGDLAVRLRDHAVHLATALSPVQHAVATATEEVDLAYRKSAVVVRSHHRRGSTVHPGDHFPPMPDPEVQRRLTAVSAATTGHSLITIAPPSSPAPAPVMLPDASWRQILISDTGERPSGYDDTVADPKGVVGDRLGLAHGGRLVLRPDGYIGYLDDLTAVGIDPYLDLLTGRSAT